MEIRPDEPKVIEPAIQIQSQFNFALSRSEELSGALGGDSITPTLDQVLQGLAPDVRQSAIKELDLLRMLERVQNLGRVLGITVSQRDIPGFIGHELEQRERNDRVLRRSVAKTLINDEQRIREDTRRSYGTENQWPWNFAPEPSTTEGFRAAGTGDWI